MTILLQSWKLLDRGQRVRVMLLQLLSVVVAVATLAGVAAVAPFLAVLTDPSVAERQPLLRWWVHQLAPATPGGLVASLGAVFVLAVLLSNAVNLAAAYLGTRTALEIGGSMQLRLFAEYLRRPYIFHTGTNSAHLLNTVVYEAGRLGKGVLQHAFSLSTSLATTILIVAAMAGVNLALTLVITGLLLCAYAGFYGLTRRQLRRAGDRQATIGGLQVQTVREGLAGVREVIVSGSRVHFLRRFERLNREFLRIFSRSQLLAQSPRHIMEFAAAAGIVGSVVSIAQSEPAGGLVVPQVAFLGLATYRLLPAMQAAYTAVARIRVDGAALREVMDSLQRSQSVGEDDAGRPTERHGGCLQSIELHGVTFRYPGHAANVLEDLSLHIAANRITGLTGSNGSGKTTLADIIAGLLTPDAGRVLVDGVMLDRSSRTAWQSVLAYVPQDPFLLDASIAENIALGVDPERIDRDELQRVLEKARLTEWVSSLPDGHDQQIGEGGVRLSGGQRQRIAIARGLFRRASVIILDEPTSSLDAAAEQGIMDVLASLRSSCTIVVISHLQSTLARCDQVVELPSGRLLRAPA